LPLLEATLVEEPSEVEVQTMGPIYDAIYVSDKPELEPQPYWKRHQKSLFVALLLVIFILIATMIGVLVPNEAQDPTDSRNPQQLAEPALEYGASTESMIDLATLSHTPSTITDTTPVPTPPPTPSQSSSLLDNNRGESSVAWLSAHNTRRQYYHESVYGSTYIPLIWSESLASSAQEWAETENDGSGCSVYTQGSDTMGQTGYAYWTTQNDGMDSEDVLSWWVDDEEELDYPNNKKFTQAVWRASKVCLCVCLYDVGLSLILDYLLYFYCSILDAVAPSMNIKIMVLRSIVVSTFLITFERVSCTTMLLCVQYGIVTII
jgi:uncharacterized protein YkwD